MRAVAVTEGDKVEAQMTFGYAVNGYGVGDLVAVVNAVEPDAISRLVAEYEDVYDVADDLQRGGARHESVRAAARIELGLRRFLEDGGFTAFTTTFEDLHGLVQLPGLAVQRLMAEGYGFGAEGDWKTAALLRAMKVMSAGLPGGTSFMEDYTYHFDPTGMQVLGAHMLEICPSIAAGTPRLEVRPLSIGSKADPARLVFDAQAGAAINVTVVDLGNRFRMVVNDVESVPPTQPLPRLPVARALWNAHPSLRVAAAAWIYAGGAHHTVFSHALTVDHLDAYAEMAGIELAYIHAGTDLRQFRRELRWDDTAYRLAAPSARG